MLTNLGSEEEVRDASGDVPDVASSTAIRSDVVRWESMAWITAGAAWVVSAWPGVLVEWQGVAVAAGAGLCLLVGFVAWQIVANGAPVTQPARWVGQRVRIAEPRRRTKSRRFLAVTVIVDAAGWALSGIGWCVAARAFSWSETLTGAPVQVAFGTTFVGWGLLHIPAARRLAASDDNVVVVSRRVLGSGPPTIDTGHDTTGRLATSVLRHKQRRVSLVQRGLLNPPMRGLTYLGLLPHHAVLETTGRRTGRSRRTVVGVAHQPDRVLWIIAEHGSRAGYVRNIGADPNVRVHLGLRWQRGSAHLVDNDDITARLELFPRHHAKIVRRFGTDLATIRVDLAA